MSTSTFTFPLFNCLPLFLSVSLCFDLFLCLSLSFSVFVYLNAYLSFSINGGHPDVLIVLLVHLARSLTLAHSVSLYASVCPLISMFLTTNLRSRVSLGCRGCRTRSAVRCGRLTWWIPKSTISFWFKSRQYCSTSVPLRINLPVLLPVSCTDWRGVTPNKINNILYPCSILWTKNKQTNKQKNPQLTAFISVPFSVCLYLHWLAHCQRYLSSVALCLTCDRQRPQHGHCRNPRPPFAPRSSWSSARDAALSPSPPQTGAAGTPGPRG